jgi:hypothetical protein
MENITSIIAQGVLSIAGALASYFIAVGVTYLKKKREALINQLGIDQYNKDYKIAQDLYYVVEQQFKFIPQAGGQKAKAFDKLLTEKIPGISQEELDHFREAIVGKVNAGIVSSGILAPAFAERKDIADVATAQSTPAPTEAQPAQK